MYYRLLKIFGFCAFIKFNYLVLSLEGNNQKSAGNKLVFKLVKFAEISS